MADQSGEDQKKSDLAGGEAGQDRTVIRPKGEGASEDATPVRAQSPLPYVVVVEGPRTGARFSLVDGANIIGRAPGNAIRLEDQSVSRQHAEIIKGATDFSVRDLGSKNGTAVGDNPVIEPVIIAHKDIIKVGIYQLRLITQPVTVEEELALPQEAVISDRTIFVAAPPDGLTSEVHKYEVSEEEEGLESEAEQALKSQGVASGEGVGAVEEELSGIKKLKKLPIGALINKAIKFARGLNKRQIIIYGALGVVVFIAIVYFTGRMFSGPAKKTKRQIKPSVIIEQTEEGQIDEGQVIPAMPPSMPAGEIGQGQPPPIAEPAQPEAPTGDVGVPPSPLPAEPPGQTDITGSPPAAGVPSNQPTPTQPPADVRIPGQGIAATALPSAGTEAPIQPGATLPGTVTPGIVPGVQGQPSEAASKVASAGAPTTAPQTAPQTVPTGNLPVGQDVAAQKIATEPPKMAGQTIPVFLDFASSPMPAKVVFQTKELGLAPLRVNIELEAGRAYLAQAIFVMPDISQQYTQQVDFTVEKGKSVIPILFRGPIGILKVNDLPRDAQFYLEGKFSYDKFQEQSVKLQEVILQKPIYIPYGNYVLELRRNRQMGASSQTVVTDIVYRRDFVVAQDSPTYTLAVKDDDLKVFPAKVKTDPINADVYIDGKQVGKTPFEGNFPLGEHKLTIRKEGYFEHNEDIKNDINTPVITDVTLKTSIAGSHINNARQAMTREMYQEAINELAEALNSQPAPTEVALSNYLLGTCYLKLNDVQRAMGYFEQARVSTEQRYPSMLGLVNCYAIQNKSESALPLLVEVMLRAEDDATKKEAHDLFQKLSPFKSVIYVYTEPAGAKVIVNDKPLAQPTPVILHELPLGNYRLRVEKAGFLPTDLNLSLSVNEFNPVIVKMKPVPK